MRAFFNFLLVLMLALPSLPLASAEARSLTISSSFVALEWLARTAPPILGADISLKTPGRVVEISAGVGLRLGPKRIRRIRPRLVSRVSPRKTVVESWQPDLSGIPLVSENYDGAGAGGTFIPPTPPTLSLSAPTTGFIDDVVLIDARASTGVSTKPQSDGTMSFTMDLGDGTPLVHILGTGHAYRDAGVYTIRINGKNSAGEAATEVTHEITISAIPAATGGGIQTLTDTANLVTNATNLQNAINTASTANTVEQEIVLPDDFDVKGPIVLQPTTGNKFITIRWANISTLPHKKRVNPETQTLTALPTIFAPNNTSAQISAIDVPNPQTTSLVKYYRLQGIHIARENNAAQSQNLIRFGQDAYNGTDNLTKMNHHFILDRNWVDGGTTSAATLQSGFRAIGNYITVVDSHFAHFRLVGGGVDAEAMSIAISQGPNAVVNNRLIASSENFNNGGGSVDYRNATISSPTTTTATLSNGRHFFLATGTDEASPTNTENLSIGSTIALPSASCAQTTPYCVEMVTAITAISGNNITYDAVPFAPTNGGSAQWSDNPMFLEFRHNYMTKPVAWRHFLADGTTVNPSWNGDDTQIKNIWEAKACMYCRIDGNVAEGTWHSSQPYALTITVRNQNGQFSNTAAIRYLQWTNNLLKDAQNGMNITGSDDGITQVTVSAKTRDVLVANNLHWNAGYVWDNAGPKDFMRLGEGNPGRLDRIFVMHNTYDGANGSIVNFGTGGASNGVTNAMWFNNAHEFSLNGFMDSLGTPTRFQVENIQTYFPPGDATAWNKNLVVNPAFSSHYGTYAPMPAAAIVIGGVNADGSSTGDTVAYSGQFVNYAQGDFTLAVTSPGKAAASDGTDVGVNMTALKTAIGASSSNLLTATINAVTGDWTVQAGGQAAIMAGKIVITGRVSIQ